jgi:alpha-1,6-mannosyltransferase
VREMISATRALWDRINESASLNKAFLIFGLTLELGFAAFFQLSNAKNWTWLPVLFFVLFATYLLAIIWAKKKMSADSVDVLIILIFAIAFRITLLFSGPVLSFDIYRYIWDGKVAANGINPFIYPPQAPQLASLRDTNWAMINHKELTTGYPPLMEALFELLYVVYASVATYKITFFLFDVGTIIVLLFLLKELKLDVRNLIIYAWAPLSVVEISQTGHNESVVIFFVLLAFLLMFRGRTISSAFVMGLAVISKIYPVFFAPILFKQWGKRGTILFFVVTLASHIPYLGAGAGIYASLLFVLNTTYFNGSIFPLITSVIDWTGITSNPGLLAQLVVYAIFGSLLVWAFEKSLRSQLGTTQLMEMSFLLTGALLLVNRSFFSWYMIWIIPFLAFYTYRSWLLLSGTTFLGYLKYNSFPPPDHETVSPQIGQMIAVVEYLPFYAILAYELVKRHCDKSSECIQLDATPTSYTRIPKTLGSWAQT